MLGIVDIGTNSVRMLVVEGGAALELVESHLITTRLGQGLSATGVLSVEAMDRTLAALCEFKRISLEKGFTETLLIATSAVREAKNREELLQRVSDELGWNIEVISGEREAFLGFLGVVKGLPQIPEKPLVIDIGGGSTEIIWGSDGELNFTSSLAGAVRMTEARSDRTDVLKVLAPVLQQVQKSGCLNAVGIGGTVTTLAAIDLEMINYDPEKIHGYEITLERIREIKEQLACLTLEERKNVKGLQPARADIIVAGAAILEVILSELEIKSITVSERDIMYGLAYEYLKGSN